MTDNFSLNHMPRWSLVPGNPSALLNSSMHVLQIFYNLGILSLPHWSPLIIRPPPEWQNRNKPGNDSLTQAHNTRSHTGTEQKAYSDFLSKTRNTCEGNLRNHSSHLYPIFSISQMLPISYWISHRHLGCWILFLQDSTTLLAVKSWKHESVTF